jgi:hypothetical protein
VRNIPNNHILGRTDMLTAIDMTIKGINGQRTIHKSPAKTTGLSIDISKQREQYTAINWYYIIVIYQE